MRYSNIGKNKFFYLTIIVFFVLFASIALPSLARHKNRIIPTFSVWDGSVATSYSKGNGSKNNPFVISNGSEFAYFADNLENEDYEDTYFVLSNNIVLNDGIFSYDKNNGLKYIKDDRQISIAPYQDEYEELNKFKTLKNFKGHLDGNYYRIYGVFISEDEETSLGLFTNLEGSIKNLYVENSVIYGGSITAGIAASTSNSTITNTLFNGYVINGSANTSDILEVNLDDIQKSISSNLTEQIEVQLPIVNGIIKNVTLTGTVSLTGQNSSLVINGTEVSEGEFTIDLGSSLIGNVNITYNATTESTFQLTNFKYNINYEYSYASGIVANSKGTELNGVINKSDVYGNLYAAGLIGKFEGTGRIDNSYNTGSINSNKSAGLIMLITGNSNNVSISHSYNTGLTRLASFVGIINNNTGVVNINNSFSAIDKYAIDTISNTTVNIENVLLTSDKYVREGNVNGEFLEDSVDNIKNISKETLSFYQYVDNANLINNPNNVWLYENTTYPILYIDDINDPIAKINITNHSWNNLSYELTPLKFSSTLAFNVEGTNNLRPVKEVYYYLSNSRTALTYDEIENITNWGEYSNVVQLNESGFYVIYVKVVDYDDNIYYINTDLIILDLTGSNVTISLNNNSWTTFSTNLRTTYVDRDSNVIITAEDELSGIKSIEYFISEDELSASEVEAFENWNVYTNSIMVNKITPTIIYVKVVDNSNYVTYVNTNKIVVGGYNLNTLYAGKNTEVEKELYVSSDSLVSFNFSYSGDIEYTLGYKHVLTSNVLLPTGTEITLIDKVNSRVYKLITNNENNDYGFNLTRQAKYNFSLFEEVGTGSEKKMFDENNFSGKVRENFEIWIDFKNANIESNLTKVDLLLNLYNDDELIVPTISGSAKSFNVMSVSSKAELNLTTTYGGIIRLNSNSNNLININASLDYKEINDNKIIDTTYENKNIGLAIKIVDKDDKIVPKEQFKNLIFAYGERNYYASNDGIVRINPRNGLEDLEGILNVITYTDNVKLKNGNYKMFIGVYTSFDNMYTEDIEYKILIPIVVTESNNYEYSFDIGMNNEQRIINGKEDTRLTFNITNIGEFENPNVRVSLYKKVSLSAYNQDYVLIDLNEYLKEPLTRKSDFVYEAVSSGAFELNIKKDTFENNGYMLLFELYDGNKKIEEIKKKIIVK